MGGKARCIFSVLHGKLVEIRDNKTRDIFERVKVGPIHHEEIEKVAAHLARGLHRGEYVELAPVRERRKHAGQWLACMEAAMSSSVLMRCFSAEMRVFSSM